MNKQEFRELCRNRILFLDGATGSNLMKAGMPAGVCPEQWILEHADVMLKLQQDYVDAGSDILYAPTFTTNRLKLREYDLEEKQEEMIRGLVAISKKAAAGKALVAGDLTMTGVQLSPIGPLDFEELIDIYKEQITCMVNEGVDLLVVETMMSAQETRAALIAAKEVCDLPVLATLTFEQDGRTLYGTDARTAVITLQSLGADAVGANCSTGPDRMVSLIRDMYEAATVPIIAKPNAGMPCLLPDGSTGYSMEAEEFSVEIQKLVDAGASVIGGCCGTTPEFIKKSHDVLADCKPVIKEKSSSKIHYLTSERKTLSFTTDSPFMVIGERINPTGKKKLQAELKEGSLAMVSSFASDQTEMGASILDVNMGMSGIDEKEMMLKALEEVTTVSNLPVSIDSSHVDVIEAALRRYPGRALINSISMESEKCEPLLKLAAKYGAMFILLPLSDEGLPATLADKIHIIETIMKRAEGYGLLKEDLVVDGLVMTVGASPEAAADTLKTFAYCKEHGIATTCGLSNISFGLPERSYVNASFLTMAIQQGLTMAIANPSQRLLMSSALAADLLMNKENADIRYIEYTSAMKEKDEKEAAVKAQKLMQDALRSQNGQGAGAGQKAADPLPALPKQTGAVSAEGAADAATGILGELKEIYDFVLKGRRTEIVDRTRTLVESGFQAADILNKALMPAIDEVGILFDKGKYFLPQLINSAEAMKNSIAVLEPYLAADRTGEQLPTIVIATVKGDIHDIGKNLVALMLKNHGFRVIDLGKDVEKEIIIETARKEHAAVIALSALMTTTMLQMKEVVELAKQEKLDCKIIIGGAVITNDYAQEIGADGYSRDAAEAVVLVKRLLNIT